MFVLLLSKIFPVRIDLKKTFLVLSVITVLFLSACNDDPSSLGSKLLESDFGGDLIDVKTFDSKIDTISQSFENYQVPIDTLSYLSAERLLLGQIETAKASTLLKFYLDPSTAVLDSIKNLKYKITRTFVKLLPYYEIGEKSGFNFEAKRILKDWSAVKFNLDSLKALKPNISPGNLLTNLVVSGDTLITFDLPVSLIESWYQDNINKEVKNNLGIILEPTAGSKKIVGFEGNSSISTAAYMPQLNVVYTNSANKLDTLQYIPTQDTYVVEKLKDFNANGKIIVQPVLGYKSSINFNFKALPSHIAINKAEMELYVDKTNSIENNHPLRDSIVIAMYSDTKRTISTESNTAAVLISKGDYYSGNITNMMQTIVNDPAKYFGLNMNLLYYDVSLSRLVFHSGLAADKNLRPRIIIYYTKK